MRPMPASTVLPNETRALVACIAIGLCAAANAAHGLLYGWLVWNYGLLEDTSTAEMLEQATGVAMMATLTFGAIAFLFWFRRAYGNAHAVGLRGTYHLGWSVGAWFVPILNLFRPVQIASEMWRHAGHERTGSIAIVALWWTAYLLGNFSDRAAGALIANRNEDVAVLGIRVAAASDAITVVAGILAITMIRRLTAAHRSMAIDKQAEVFE
jgi:hypothetical protein